MPVVYPPYPFHTIHIDVIGENVSFTARKQKYCLTLTDQHSKWTEVIALSNLSAKTACDLLLDIFMCTGIAEIIF